MRTGVLGRRYRRLVTLLTAVAATIAAVVSTALGVASAAAPLSAPVNSELPWHPAVIDASGALLPWYEPQRGLGYDQVLRLGWNFLEHGIPNEAGTDLKTYLVNSVLDGTTG